jgi:hypothetical protein
MLDAHISGTQNNARVLYTVYAFIVWYEIYFVKEAQSSAVIDVAEKKVSKESEKLLFDTENEHRKIKNKGKIKADREFEEIYTDNFGF